MRSAETWTDLRRQAFDCRHGRYIYGKAQTRGETYSAQHAQFVLSKAPLRFSDRANDSSVQIRLATDVVENLSAVVAHQQTINCEIAPLHIVLRGLGVSYRVGMPPVGVAYIRTKRSHLHFYSVARHQNYAKLRADSHAVRKKLQHAFRCGVGGHVIIRSLASEE